MITRKEFDKKYQGLDCVEGVVENTLRITGNDVTAFRLKSTKIDFVDKIAGSTLERVGTSEVHYIVDLMAKRFEGGKMPLIRREEIAPGDEVRIYIREPPSDDNKIKPLAMHNETAERFYEPRYH
ncbi:MAG: hypothetical protein KKH88_02955 [Nanoarchaeota archaeon]|nr:hypothetical protein [Nanoarchaeota archaeon]